MLRVYHLLIGIILLIFIPIGARLVLPQFSQNKTPIVKPSVTPANQTTTKTNSKTANIWQNILSKTTAPSGWEVSPCTDKDTLLCVSEKGQLLGTVEMRVELVSNQPEFQKHLTAAGIPIDSKADYQNPEFQAKVVTALQAWVTDFYANLAKNRPTAHNNPVILSPYPVQPVTIGKLPGIRYGFVGIKTQGGVEEQHISYVTYDGKKLYTINTAFTPGTDPGKFNKLEDLAIFQPYLYAIAENLNLPIHDTLSKP